MGSGAGCRTGCNTFHLLVDGCRRPDTLHSRLVAAD